MADMEKVMKAIEYCTDDALVCHGDTCPYWQDAISNIVCWNNLMKDALALLKAQDETLRYTAKVCFGETDASTIELILRRLAKMGYIDTDGKVWRLKDD